MRFDIVTFGSAVVDVFVNTDVAEKNSSISYPVGEKILIKELKFDIGGGGTNTAVAFSRLGFKTGCICKLGGDENGREILEMLLMRYLKGDASPLARRLLARSENEVAIEIRPMNMFSWDYSERMQTSIPST